MLKIDQKLLYNIPEMDDEHAELIQRAEKVMAAYQNGDPQQELLRLFAFLQSYVIEHFSHEEALQFQYSYPEYTHHQKIHHDFKQDIDNLYHDIVKHGLTLESRVRLSYLVSEWITKHIGEEDKKLADYLHKLGVK